MLPPDQLSGTNTFLPARSQKHNTPSVPLIPPTVRGTFCALSILMKASDIFGH